MDNKTHWNTSFFVFASALMIIIAVVVLLWK